MNRKPICACEYCDPLLWAQAQAMVAATSGTHFNRKAASVVGLLAELVRDAAHPDQKDNLRDEAIRAAVLKGGKRK